MKDSIFQLSHQREISSSEENIKDLLDLANLQISKKVEEINNIKKNISNPDIESLSKLSRNELSNMLHYHKSIISTIEKLIN